MTANARTTGLIAALLCLLAAGARAEPVRGVVELFTSQACSACPPADRLIRDMARDEGLVTISWAVDYWDYTGWKDTLALPACSARQKAYAAARGDGHVYTPQAVVDGLGHVAGADRTAIDSALRDHASRSLASGVRAALTEAGDRLDVTVDGPEAAAPARVILIGVAREITVLIARGENRGSRMTYSNIVRSAADLGVWRGGAQSFSAPRGAGDYHVALVQRGDRDRPGAILAAARR
jgi:hypothetical protein